MWRGLTRWGGTFARTPKFRLEGRSGRWTDSRYRLGVDRGVVGEIVLALCALATALVACASGHYGFVPFSLLYAAAFGTVAGMGLAQGASPRRRPRRPSMALKMARRGRRQDAE